MKKKYGIKMEAVESVFMHYNNAKLQKWFWY